MATRGALMTPDEAEKAVADDELPILVLRVTRALVDRFNAEREREGQATALSPAHGLAMRYIASHDEVTTVAVAQHLGVTKQSASELVGALERAGYVERAPHPGDRRARVLVVSAEGRRRLAASRARWRRLEAEWADLVGPDELDHVRHALGAWLTAAATV
jgi:DNA-binding MarR family transcriptional regulator